MPHLFKQRFPELVVDFLFAAPAKKRRIPGGGHGGTLAHGDDQIMQTASLSFLFETHDAGDVQRAQVEVRGARLHVVEHAVLAEQNAFHVLGHGQTGHAGIDLRSQIRNGRGGGSAKFNETLYGGRIDVVDHYIAARA